MTHNFGSYGQNSSSKFLSRKHRPIFWKCDCFRGKPYRVIKFRTLENSKTIFQGVDILSEWTGVKSLLSSYDVLGRPTWIRKRQKTIWQLFMNFIRQGSSTRLREQPLENLFQSECISRRVLCYTATFFVLALGHARLATCKPMQKRLTCSSNGSCQL